MQNPGIQMVFFPQWTPEPSFWVFAVPEIKHNLGGKKEGSRVVSCYTVTSLIYDNDVFYVEILPLYNLPQAYS